MATAQTTKSTSPVKSLDRQTYTLHAGESKVGYAQAVLVGNTLHISGTVSQGKTMAEQVDGTKSDARSRCRQPRQ
jgi:enamine deaminase RidA (YjgF/YER057c/UK114 family)